ncbi:MAG: response regulator [Lachnospiraceae bacterium]|nr:response regulator [Lachnospiraceae bacterium]
MNNKNVGENSLFQTSHLMILVSYSLFSAILIGESFLMGWETWAVFLIVIAVLGCWFMHLQNVLTSYQRLWVYSILMMVTSVFYGIHLTSTYDLVGVITACVVMFTMTGVKTLITFWQVTYYLILAYDLVAMYKQGYVFDGLVISRTLLHVMLMFMVGWIARVIIRKWTEIIYESKEEIEVLVGATTRLNDFLANVSHEIRTPINAVMGLTEVCIEKEDNPEIQKDLAAVKDAGKRVAEQISDILDYSEIDMKKLAVNNEEYMLSSILNDIVTELGYVKPVNLELVVDVDAACPAMMITDVPKLKKIIWHLVSNGIKYTKEGGVYVHISTVSQEYGVNLCIEVEDTGVGMTKEELEHISEHFYQGNSGRTRSTSGLGLGMAIVTGFVQVLGGFMIVESEKGKGTRVRVSIPQQVIDPSKCMSLSTKDNLCIGSFLHFDKFPNLQVREFYNVMVKHIVQGLGVTMRWVETPEKLRTLTDTVNLTHLFVGEEEYMENTALIEELARKMVVAVIANPNFCQVPWSKIRIMPKPFYCFPVATLLNQDPNEEDSKVGRLMCRGVRALVVDDEPMNHMVAKGIFKRYGMEVFTADSGAESIEMVQENTYDIVFMDHMMPEMDGIEAMKRIRMEVTRQHKELPIVALTANAVSTAKEMFLREGFDGFISKPIELTELERVLRKVLPKELCMDVYDDDLTDHSKAAAPVPEPEKTVAPQEPQLSQPAVPEPETSSAQEEITEGPIEKLAALGIDTTTGLYYCQNDEEFYKSLLLQYAGDAPKKQVDAAKYCVNKDYPNYAIIVHAMKSTSKMIGAGRMSDMAKALEEAAKSGDDEYIQLHHEEAMSEYKRLVEGISKAYEEPSDGDDADDAGDEVMEFMPDDDVMEFMPDDEAGDSKPDDDIMEFLPEED